MIRIARSTESTDIISALPLVPKSPMRGCGDLPAWPGGEIPAHTQRANANPLHFLNFPLGRELPLNRHFGCSVGQAGPAATRPKKGGEKTRHG
jgi:hypothetical protein